MRKSADLTELERLVPFDALPSDILEVLRERTAVQVLQPDQVLFRVGDDDEDCVYLLEGEVELLGDSGGRTVVGGTWEARYALARLKPRRFTGITRSPVRVIRLDADTLDRALTWDQSGRRARYEVKELNATPAQDWMSRLLTSPLFQRIPPANLQAIFTRLEPLRCEAGATVIKQGDEGDSFYVVQSGRCRVTRESPIRAHGVLLAELGPGDSFGEEALLSDSRRNATVTMAEAGVLMRLTKRDFNALLKQPSLRYLTYRQIEETRGDADVLVDVRLPSEHDHWHVPGSINIPLYFLRTRARGLDPGKRYIVYCDTGRRSAAGAFLLGERGLEAYVLKGGLAAVPGADRS
jgi:CRP-like cAMP-binding protein